MLEVLDVTPVTLLVVPGKDWSDGDMAQLRDWQAQGLLLAGHGWTHEVRDIRRFYHRLHSLLLSRRAAEHLSLDGDEILSLIKNNYEWFLTHDLTPPNLYVPPAWALGRVDKAALQDLPFDYYELLGSVLNARSGKESWMPLVGYQADTRLRALALRPWNYANQLLSGRSGLALRIGLHPGDDDLHLAAQMRRQIRACDRYISYAELFCSLPEETAADDSAGDAGTDRVS